MPSDPGAIPARPCLDSGLGVSAGLSDASAPANCGESLAGQSKGGESEGTAASKRSRDGSEAKDPKLKGGTERKSPASIAPDGGPASDPGSGVLPGAGGGGGSTRQTRSQSRTHGNGNGNGHGSTDTHSHSHAHSSSQSHSHSHAPSDAHPHSHSHASAAPAAGSASASSSASTDAAAVGAIGR